MRYCAPRARSRQKCSLKDVTAQNRGEGIPTARHFLVAGRVQGVNFRGLVADAARELGLTGFAKNLQDGSTVEVVAEGEARKLDELERRLKIGPPAARVDSVKSAAREHKGAYRGFLVL